MVRGLDPSVATVTRKVESGSIKYTITPLNTPSGYTAYILVDGQAYKTFVDVPVAATKSLTVHIINAKRDPSYWWQYQTYEGVTNPSSEYTIRQTMILPGHQFIIETGSYYN